MDYPPIDVGYFELNRNPENYFQEIELAAFSPSNVVPGISWSPDKMLQARIFSYADAHPEGPVQSAAVRRQRRRADSSRPRVLLRAARAAPRAQPGVGLHRLKRRASSCRRPPTKMRVTFVETSASRRPSHSPRATTWCGGSRTTNQAGLQLPGTGYIWTNNVDTLQNTLTSIASDRLLNEVRGQWSRYYDLRAAKCDCVQFNRTGYSVTGGVATGTWGVIPEDTWDLSDTLSLWRGAHSFKMGGGATYDVTTQRYLPNQNGVYTFAGGPAVAPNPTLFTQAFALVPGQDIIYPKGVGTQRLRAGRVACRNNFTLNYGARYDVELVQGHSRLARAGRQEQHRSARRLQLGSARRSAVVGPRRRGALYTAEPDLHDRQGRGARPQRHRHARAAAERSGVSDVSERAAGVPSGRGAPARNIQEISPDLENEFAWQYSIGAQRQIGSRTSASVDVNVNRSHKHGFLDTNYPTPISKDVINAADGQVVRTSAQADLTRPIRPAPNGFRRIEVLTNEGRTWYQGVRFGVQHRTTPLLLSLSYTYSDAEDRLNHWEIPEDSSNPELDHADSASNTPHNFVGSATWNIPGQGAALAGLAGERRGARAERQSIQHPLRADITGTTQVFCTAQRTCNVTTP